MSNLSTLVGIIAGLAGIAVALVSLLKYLSTGPNRRDVIIRSSIIGVVVICIIALSGFISTSTTISFHEPINPLASNATEPTTATPSPTLTPTNTIATSTPVSQLLYKANFQNERAVWGANNFIVSSDSLTCNGGDTLCSAEAPFQPSSSDFEVNIKVQFLTAPAGSTEGQICVKGRVSSNYPDGVEVGLDSYVHDVNKSCSLAYADSLGGSNVGSNPFTEIISYKNTTVNIIVSQPGNNTPFMIEGVVDTDTGKIDLVATTSLKILSFQVYSN